MTYFRSLYQRVYRRVRDEFFPTTHPFDCINGVDTSGTLSLWRLDISSPNRRQGRDYQGVEPGRFEDALNEIREDFARFTFVDLGCGKGRALVMAHRLGFRRLIGVEFSAQLAETANRNLAKLRLTNIEVLVQDVAEYRFPAGPLVVFSFNSFGPEILKQVLSNLRSCNDTLYFAYVNPLHDATIAADGFLTAIRCGRFHSVWHFEPVRNNPVSGPAPPRQLNYVT